MSARDEMLDEYGRADTAPLGTLADLRRKLDAHRAEVLAENGNAAAERDCLAMAVLFALQWKEGAPVGLREGIEQILSTMPKAGEQGSREAGAAPAVTVFRASHDSIVMGLYTTATEARAHCVAEERRTWSTGANPVFDWIEDEEDGVAELVTVAEDGETETITGYVVTALEVASKYDPEADE
jgi:hypothetical protein